MGTSSCEVLSLTVWDFSATGARPKPQDSHFASPQRFGYKYVFLPCQTWQDHSYMCHRPHLLWSQASFSPIYFYSVFFFFWQGRGVHPALVSKLNREAFGIEKRNLNNFVTPKIVSSTLVSSLLPWSQIIHFWQHLPIKDHYPHLYMCVNSETVMAKKGQYVAEANNM